MKQYPAELGEVEQRPIQAPARVWALAEHAAAEAGMSTDELVTLLLMEYGARWRASKREN